LRGCNTARARSGRDVLQGQPSQPTGQVSLSFPPQRADHYLILTTDHQKSFCKHGTPLLSIDISLNRRRVGWRTVNANRGLLCFVVCELIETAENRSSGCVVPIAIGCRPERGKCGQVQTKRLSAGTAPHQLSIRGGSSAVSCLFSGPCTFTLIPTFQRSRRLCNVL
jgi:hypothetical protein